MPNYYIRFSGHDIEGLQQQGGIVELYVEVSENGRVLREIGVNDKGDVVYVFPSAEEKRGLFDLVPVETIGLKSDLKKEDFERLWRDQNR